MQQQTPFLFVGNQPVLDFINTELVVNGQPVDLLPSFANLVNWLLEAGLINKKEAYRMDEERSSDQIETLKQARGFRAAMREMAERLAAGKPVSQAAIDAVNQALRHRVGYPQLTLRQGAVERKYQAEFDHSKELIGLLGEAACDLLVMRDPSLVKKCQNPACVLFFYDTTKNHARHWCSMNLCGNRSKVAAHYRRQRKRKT